MTATPVTAAYAVDADGRIVWTDEGFAALARDHGHPELAGTGLVGRPLTEYVSGERPRALQQAILARAHALGEPIELRYRCDAPEMRRHATLRIDPRADGGVVFTTWFDEVEARPYQPLLDPNRPRADEAVGFCAWCNRVDAGGWREADDLPATAGKPPRVAHTVCAICELLLSRPAGEPTRSGPSGPA